jgi:hypothetical protein
MKILKYIIAFILICILLFIAIGFIKPTVNYGHEIEVDKSAKEAWAVHIDDSKYGQWLDGFKSIDLISGELGEIGSKYKVVVNPGEGQPDFEMIEIVKDKKDYEYVDLNFDSDMMTFDQRTTFVENNGKTKIKTESKVGGKGIMMKSMFALMEMLGGSFQAQEEKNLEALKTVINSNTTDYYPKPMMDSEKELETSDSMQ